MTIIDFILKGDKEAIAVLGLGIRGDRGFKLRWRRVIAVLGLGIRGDRSFEDDD